MAIKHEEDADAAAANISVMTASMSLDDNSDSDDHQLLDSDDDLLIQTSAGFAQRGSTPPVVKGVSTPPHSPKAEAVEGPEIESFLQLAAETASLSIPDEPPKFAVVMAANGQNHVFSRSWVSKKSHSSVVEKPERLKAACLGIGMAKALVPMKLMKTIRKSSLYCPHFEAVHGKDWATELYALCGKAASKLSRGELEVPESWPYYDIYLAPSTIDALEGNVSALELGVDEIFTKDIKRAFVVVRPPGHHCHEDAASGFCIINNAHIAIQYAKLHHKITHAIILDFDLHHGDGSQDLVWKLGFRSEGPADLHIGYFSLHDINSFPCEAGFAQPEQLSNASVCFVAHRCAIWNTHLKSYDTKAEFDQIYKSDYSVLFQKAAEFLEQEKTIAAAGGSAFKPLIVLSAGFDGSEFESPGMQRHRVNVPTSFYNRFTRDSIALADHYSDGHLISLLEGGYSPAAVSTGVFSHLTGLAGLEYNEEKWCLKETTPHEVEWGMRQRWRFHAENWAAHGIQLGRALFPVFDRPLNPPSSAPTNAEPEGKHNLRRRPQQWSI